MAGQEMGGSSSERLRKLQAITDAALGPLAVDELLDELLVRVRDALDADTSAVLLLDEEKNELVARAAKGLEQGVEQGVRLPVGRGFAGRVAAERRPVVLENVDHADVLNPILRAKGIKSLLGAPLLARGRVLGVVHVGTLAPRVFTQDDIELLQLVAERLALALERALVHEELVVLDALKREFVSTAAHEIRAPATIIYGIAKTFAEHKDTLSPETLNELVEALYTSSVRLAQLTEDLLDFSRLEVSRGVLATKPLQLRQVIEDLSVGMSTDPRDAIQIKIPEDLVLEADRDALERIVGNLVSNSLLHGAPPVTISASRAGDEARIWVEDRGPGIPQAFVSRLFEAFARPTEASGKPGAGLGLAIAQSYANKIGGDLLYEPASPTGARFTLVFPQPS